MSTVSSTLRLLGVLLVVSLFTSTVASPADFFPASASTRVFHAYNLTIDHSREPQCQSHHDRHAKTDIRALVKKYKLWPGLIPSNRTLTPASTLFGFEEALEVIWKHQHPEDCSKVKFFISGDHNGGFGSELHVQSSALGLAMNMDRVYLQNPFVHSSMTWEMDNPHCKAQGKTNLECYYEPWSSCTVFDALGPNALSILRNVRNLGFPDRNAQINSFVWTGETDKLVDPAALQAFNQQYEKSKVVLLRTMGRLKHGVLPNCLRPLVACSSVPPDAWYYWWRSVSTSFTARPNNASLLWMQTHALGDFEAHVDSAIGVYVRRGDKAREMRLAPLPEYWEAVHLLWKSGFLKPFTKQLSHEKKAIFLATEDTSVIDEMIKWKNKHDLLMDYTNIFDRHGMYAEKSVKERSQMMDPNKNVHHPEEYLSMMLNIQYLLRNAGWVCTLSSNYCRILDELRATVAAKADHPFVDLSTETCAKPPCVYTPLLQYDWR